MKNQLFLGLLAAATAFTACSSNDEIANEGTNPSLKGNAYMNVSLVMNNGSGITRATEDKGFDHGTADESAIDPSTISFYFYNAQGAYITTGKVSEALNWTEGAAGDNVSHTSNAVVVLGPTTVRPTQVLAVANAANLNLENKSLSEAIAAVDNATPSAKNSFVMTNSVYVNGGKIQYATPITDANIKETADEARNNGPVNIYIERDVAKVGMEYATDGQNGKKAADGSYVYEMKNNIVYSDMNGANVQMSDKVAAVKVIGWKPNAINESGFYVKNLQDAWTTTAPITFAGWNDAANFRSYWAYDNNYTDGNGLKYYTFNDAKANGTNSNYIFENTIQQDKAAVKAWDKTNVTTMLIVAQLGTVDANGAFTPLAKDGENIYRYEGQFYSEASLKNKLMGLLKDYYVETTENGQTKHENLSVDKLTLATDGTLNGVKGTLDLAGLKMTKKNGNDYVEANAADIQKIITDELAQNDKNVAGQPAYKGLKEGYVYYQVPVEQLGSTDDNTIYGVVRNHSYRLELQGITNIGDAVYNPDVDITLIPGKDTNYYIAAKLNILSWRVVSQKVNI